MTQKQDTSSLDTANKVGSLLNSWGRIIVVIDTATISCEFAYVKIYDNERNIELYKKESQQALDEFKKDIAVQTKQIEENSDKRHVRAMENLKELKDYGFYHETRIVATEKEISYIKGTLKLDK